MGIKKRKKRAQNLRPRVYSEQQALEQIYVVRSYISERRKEAKINVPILLAGCKVKLMKVEDE